MTQPAVEVHDLSKRFRLYHERNKTLKATVMRRGRARYEDFLALEDVTFDIPRGATFGLIGENGSGKSTLLKCMARILRPEKGSVTLHGRMSALLELGAGFHPELSGRENVYLNASILGLSRRQVDARFDDIVGFAGLERFIDNPVKNYSSGMYVRLGFAVAINVEPEILLVDEVLAVGDEEFQNRCTAKFADLKRAGCTVVVVSHGMNAVRGMCDQVAWLRHGKLTGLGHTDDVIDAYLRHVKAEADQHTQEASVRTAVDGSTVRAAIQRVELLDAAGRSIHELAGRDPVTIRLAYRARDFSVELRPVFTVSRADGTWICDVQTGAPVPYVHDELVHVDYAVPSLPLQPGVYEVDIALKDKWMSQAHVSVRRAARFTVTPGPDIHMGGLVDLGGSWSSGVLETMPEGE